MTSIANPKLTTSTLPTNTANSKNTSSIPIKKEVNNNASRPSNGNTSKSPIINKKEPAQNSQIKRKSRILSSSDESDDDNQSLVREKNRNEKFSSRLSFCALFAYLASFLCLLFYCYTHTYEHNYYACSAYSTICL